MGDKKSNKSKMEKLEARVQELAVREGELMEQIYAMKLENQVNYLIAILANFPENLLINGKHLAESPSHLPANESEKQEDLE